MKRINIKDFLQKERLLYNSDKQSVSWVKRNLKPASLLRIGRNYLVDEKEINALYKDYLQAQESIRKNRVLNAKQLSKKRAKRKQQQQPPKQV